MRTTLTQDEALDTLDILPELTILLDDTANPASRLQALLLQQSADSIRIQLNTALGEDMLLRIANDLNATADREPLIGSYRVRSCRIAGLGKYHLDLTPEVDSDELPQPSAPKADELDYYEILQISRQADFDTIRRVFHILAQRYHPDNLDTGSDLRFRQVVTAHSVLSDPQKRAAYDVQLATADKARYNLFDSLQSTVGVQAEIRKRQGVLRMLYTKRLTDTQSAAIRGRDLADMLACPSEHLQFALWMLNEQRFIQRGDNNNFEITSRGVEAFEAEQIGFSKTQWPGLPAPA